MKRKVSLVAHYRIACSSTILNFIVVYYECAKSDTFTFRLDEEAVEFVKSLGLNENSYIKREFLINEDDTACEYKFSMDI